MPTIHGLYSIAAMGKWIGHEPPSARSNHVYKTRLIAKAPDFITSSHDKQCNLQKLAVNDLLPNQFQIDFTLALFDDA